jgi:hypothetical protein
MTRSMGSASMLLRGISFKDYGVITRKWRGLSSRMEGTSKEGFRKIRGAILGNTFGTTVSTILESGLKTKSMALECGNLPMEISILENGITVRSKDKEFM